MPGTRGDEADVVTVAPNDDDGAFESRGRRSDLERFGQRMLFVLRAVSDGRVDRDNDHVLALLTKMGKLESGHESLSSKVFVARQRGDLASANSRMGEVTTTRRCARDQS